MSASIIAAEMGQARRQGNRFHAAAEANLGFR